MKVKTILALHATILETLFQLAASMNETLQDFIRDCSDISLLLLVITRFRDNVESFLLMLSPVESSYVTLRYYVVPGQCDPYLYCFLSC